MDRRKADAVLELISNGATLSETCRQPSMPSRTTVYTWLDADEDFARRFDRALERGGDAVADYAHHLAANTTRENAAANRIKLDALKWRAARLNPRYGAPADADDAADAKPVVDVGAARAKLLDRFDAVAERIEAADAGQFFVSRLVDAALRDVEGRHRLDPLDDDDRKLIMDTVHRAIMPNFVALVDEVAPVDVPIDAAAAE
jgi:hypothetical protein